LFRVIAIIIIIIITIIIIIIIIVVVVVVVVVAAAAAAVVARRRAAWATTLFGFATQMRRPAIVGPSERESCEPAASSLSTRANTQPLGGARALAGSNQKRRATRPHGRSLAAAGWLANARRPHEI
jgi:hypothetical protein